MKSSIELYGHEHEVWGHGREAYRAWEHGMT
jgi:hypothetical protein